MKRLINSFAVGLILASYVSLAAAQSLTTGAINGTVRDQSGAVMASVVITARNVDTGATRETQTTGSGNFLLAQLDPGRYEVVAESNGFATTKIGPISVSVSRIASVDFSLKVGATTANVEVHQDAALIEPSNPNTTMTLNAVQLAAIPNPGNDLSYVANLAPGAVINTGAPGFKSNFGNVEFNGLPSVSNDFTIDGLAANNPFNGVNATGASGLQLGMNAVQEVSISTATYGVDQGNLSASQINFVTKTGTGSFHGNAFEIWNGSAMNANNFFLNAKGARKPHSNVNEFGASLGGPVLGKRLFFFGDLEGIRLVLPVVLNSTLPTANYENYVLQQLPMGGKDTVLGTQLPPEPQEVPVYQSMFKLIGDTSKGSPLSILGCPLNADGSPAAGSPPNGNGCANRRTFSASPFASETMFTLKLNFDHDPKNTFWYRFQLDQGQNVSLDPVNSVFNSVLEVPSRSAAAGWTHVFGPNLVNQFNPGISYLPLVTNLANPTEALSSLQFTYIVSPFSAIGNNVSSTPTGVDTTTWQLNDNVSWNKGKHAFKFGEEMRRFLFTSVFGALTNPSEIGCSLPEFTYGATCRTFQAFPNKGIEDRVRSVSLAPYGMDTVRITRKANLTLGLRVAWNSNPAGSERAISWLNGSFAGISHDLSRPLSADILTNQTNVFPETPLLQWEPRVAVSYQVRTKTVVRAGFGAFDQPASYSRYSTFNRNVPAFTTFSAGLLTSVGGSAIAPGVPGSAIDAAVAANQQFQGRFSSGELSCASPQATSGQCLPAVNFNTPAVQTKYPVIYEWSASAEQQIRDNFSLRLGYVGTRLRHGMYPTTDNSYQAACSGCFAPLPFNSAPDARFGMVTTIKTEANSSYDSLQFTAQKRFNHGLGFQFNYTFSHCLDVASNADYALFNQNGALPTLLPNGLRSTFGNCDYDIRHSVNGSYIYELPLHAKKSSLEALIGHWQVSGTVFIRGGLPVSVLGLATAIRNGTPAVFANVIQGEDPYKKEPIQGVTQPGTIQWLNPSAFQSVVDPSTGQCFPVNNAANCQMGSSSRNAFRAPSFKWTDVNISKTFRVRETLAFRFETQFYNLFNHPNFGFPNSGTVLAGIPSKPATLTNFGTISNTVQPSTGLVGGRLGADSSVRMIALRGTVSF